MPLTTTYANDILDFLLAKLEYLPAPDYVYIGLCSNDPEADGGTINELSGGGYSRVLISQKNEAFPNIFGAASNRAITNQYQLNWTKATLDWARIKGFFLSSSPIVGEKTNIFFYGAIELSEEDAAAGGLLVESGSVALFDPYTFKISFSETDAVAESE